MSRALVAPPRGRGRPKQKKDANQVANILEKRKRGRPRKMIDSNN